MTAATESPSKSLIEQIGGESQFDFLIQAYCERIQEDGTCFEASTLKGIDDERLVELMANLIQMCFAYSSTDKLNDEDVRSRIILRNYTLFQVGLDSIELEALQYHFEAALHDAWVEGKVFEQCTGRFNSLRAIFEEESMDIPTSPSMRLRHKVVSARSA